MCLKVHTSLKRSWISFSNSLEVLKSLELQMFSCVRTLLNLNLTNVVLTTKGDRSASGSPFIMPILHCSLNIQYNSNGNYNALSLIHLSTVIRLVNYTNNFIQCSCRIWQCYLFAHLICTTHSTAITYQLSKSTFIHLSFECNIKTASSIWNLHNSVKLSLQNHKPNYHYNVSSHLWNFHM